MIAHSNASIRSYHSFGFEISTNYLIEIESLDDLQTLFNEAPANKMLSNPDGWMVLGEGCNMLFTHDFAGSLLLMRIVGKTLLKEDALYVYIEAGAGEDWHSFVRYTLTQGWFGLENLSLIPGSVGAAPVQNIGAYGVEVEKYIIAVRVYDVIDRVEKTISHFECMFGYRDSIFKHQGRSRFIITHVLFRLEKHPNPVLDYAPIRERFYQSGMDAPHPLEISDAVMAIRRSKLPDPSMIGNAGSFFKNPLISMKAYDRLRSLYPTMPGYVFEEGIKVPAGWLIEQCGWKGYREGRVGCFDKQALVLVHYGGGKPVDLLHLARRIRQSVLDRFEIQLEVEVNIIGESL